MEIRTSMRGGLEGLTGVQLRQVHLGTKRPCVNGKRQEATAHDFNNGTFPSAERLKANSNHHNISA
jgi:hypothetical protein